MLYYSFGESYTNQRNFQQFLPSSLSSFKSAKSRNQPLPRFSRFAGYLGSILAIGTQHKFSVLLFIPGAKSLPQSIVGRWWIIAAISRIGWWPNSVGIYTLKPYARDFSQCMSHVGFTYTVRIYIFHHLGPLLRGMEWLLWWHRCNKWESLQGYKPMAPFSDIKPKPEKVHVIECDKAGEELL